MGVDLDEMGVDEMGSGRSGNKPIELPVANTFYISLLTKYRAAKGCAG